MKPNIDELNVERSVLTDFLARPDAYGDPEYAGKTRRLSEIEIIIDKLTTLQK
jgi:hypothetical protein